MNQHFRNRQLPAGNPLANVLVVIVGIIVISLSVALGFVVFVGMAGFMLIMAAVVSVRVWWLKRKLASRAGEAPRQAPGAKGTIRIIEGEYQEVRKSRDRDARDHDGPADNSQNT